MNLHRGFSLVELMIVVAILAIVAAWGYSSYRDTVIKSRRSEGIAELLMIADKLERYYSDQGTYAGAGLGNSANTIHASSSKNAYYNFSITTASAVQFTITATPQGGQADDSRCGTFTLDSLGTKTASGSHGDKCW
jgi:type IV pilus assembly protein PilE